MRARIEALADPETVNRLTGLSQTYMQALAKRGFSREEALKLVMALIASVQPQEHPSAGFSRPAPEVTELGVTRVQSAALVRGSFARAPSNGRCAAQD
jgi:hypothetical protein